jgi:hypothetical protein
MEDPKWDTRLLSGKDIDEVGWKKVHLLLPLACDITSSNVSPRDERPGVTTLLRHGFDHHGLKGDGPRLDYTFEEMPGARSGILELAIRFGSRLDRFGREGHLLLWSALLGLGAAAVFEGSFALLRSLNQIVSARTKPERKLSRQKAAHYRSNATFRRPSAGMPRSRAARDEHSTRQQTRGESQG